MERNLIFVGDIHGELKDLVYNRLRLIENADVIIVGDFGVGFGGPNAMDVRYKEIEKVLEEKDITIYAMRGNHDCPEYFDGKHDYARVKFLQDHKVIELGGKKIYPIGGATSVDIDFKDPRTGKSRRDENENFKRRGSRKRCWWPNESPVKEYENLPEEVDIIISHTAPLNFPPILDLTLEHLREETKESIREEREYLDFILRTIRTSKWIYGHYHTSLSGVYNNVVYRCLSISELYGTY